MPIFHFMDGQDPRDLRIAQLEREVAELKELVAQFTERAARAEARVAELEDQLNRNSGNSSRPPSSDPPGHPGKKPERKSSGRKQGGQPGHTGHRRALFPADKVTKSQDIKPTDCEKCGFQGLTGHDNHALVHQVMEIPVFALLVYQYLLHALECPRCHHVTRAKLPPGVPEDTLGVRLTALIAFLSSLHLGKRVVSEVLAQLFGAPVSPASVCMAEQKVSQAVAMPVDAVRDHLMTQNVNGDETGWFERNRRKWLWVAVSASCAYFLIQGSRNAAAAVTLLGHAFAGILTTDRHGAYNVVELRRRQVCWAHLLRDFQGMADSSIKPCRQLGLALVAQTQQLFHLWHAFKRGEMTRQELQLAMQPVMATVTGTLHVGSRANTKKLSRFCKGLLRLEPALWTFVRDEGLEPTNNRAERTLRPAVIWRKLSHGTQTEAGSLFVGRILSVVTTLRQQGRNVVQWLVEALTAHAHGTGPPSLLPQPAAP